MANELAANQGAKNALVITQQYPADRYNLLVPMQTVAEIAEIHKPVMNVVYISTNEADKEIYLQTKPDGWALTKKGLTKLMRAAGIKVLSSRPVVPSTCQKCAAMNASIGKPVRCGSCPNKDVKYEVRISVPQLTGENIDIVAHKEIIVDDVVADMSQKQKAEFLKFRNEMCESKALNRALRTAMQIKGTYARTEFQKPFVVAYLVPNLDNPNVREEAIKGMFGASHELYGTTPSAADARRTVYVDDDLHDEERGSYEAPETPMAGQTYGYQQEPEQPQEPPRQAQQHQQQAVESAPDYDPTICTECGTRCSNGVVKYSQEQFGRTLCMACQRKIGGNQ